MIKEPITYYYLTEAGYEKSKASNNDELSEGILLYLEGVIVDDHSLWELVAQFSDSAIGAKYSYDIFKSKINLLISKNLVCKIIIDKKIFENVLKLQVLR